MQATASTTRCFTAVKATRAARRSAAQPVRAMADGPTLPKAEKGEKVDSLGFKLMRPGVKVWGAPGTPIGAPASPRGGTGQQQARQGP